MEIIINPEKQLWKGLCERITRENAEIEARVRDIVDQVRDGGDAAIRELCERIDGFSQPCLKVSAAELEEAERMLEPKVKTAIDRAFANIFAFHKAEMPHRITVRTAPGVVCEQKPVPIGSVGLYIPGGTAPLFSTVLMLGVPSLIAGCPKRILCSPAGRSGKLCPELLYSAAKCGITDIWKIGGAQAVAAMAYGTETIPKVDKIFGPGNRYVTTAKQLVSGRNTSIDMPAGPSEVMVLADGSVPASFAAADLLSQAEHGRDSQAILVCTDNAYAQAVFAEVDRQASLLSRREMVEGSLSGSRIIVFDDSSKLIEFADYYAPEHLIILMSDAEDVAERITAAGSVFIGPFTPESAGDYASGTNHTLPTSSWARSCSGVNIDSFMRKMTLQKITRDGLKGLSDTIVDMAEAEGLQAHAEAVRVRIAALEASGEETEGFELKPLVRSNIAALEPYSTARDEFEGRASVFVDANENPFENGWNRYPDPRQKELKRRISQLKGVPAERIFIGNGSDEAIDLLYRIFCIPGRDNVVAMAPTYGMYRVAADINDIEYRAVGLREDFSLDTEELLAATDNMTKLIWLCSPNNPTGNALPREQILDIARRFDGIVVVDEAYIDFASQKSVAADAPRNIVVLQTLSKAYGLAALRLGIAIADPEIISLMSNVKYPYNISKAALDRASSLLERDVQGEVAQILEGRAYLQKAFAGIPAVRKVWPSDTNFILARFDDPDAVYDYLLKAGVIVRNRSRVKGCEGCLRITVGTPEENELIVKLLEKL